MSGTSLDGVDAALVKISDSQVHLLHAHYLPYSAELKQSLLALHQPFSGELHHSQLLANQLSQLYANAVTALLQSSELSAKHVRAIGCHGQTLRHCPESGYTVQIGNGALLAELTGITVVNDFRSRDIAAGGQGAPLVPAFHDHLLRHASIHRVILNLGGIANLTVLTPGQATSGFDCGPANILMDAWCKLHRGFDYDKDGAWASTGRIIPELLQLLIDEPFFALAPPKSSGRDLFNLEWLTSKLSGNELPEDVQATLMALTVTTIAHAVQSASPDASEIYLCGGGAHNLVLLKGLADALPQCSIRLTDALGIPADWMEAIAFAWLARQTLHRKPGNLPLVTGAAHPCLLGAIYPA